LSWIRGKMGHVASLTGSLVLSVVPVVLFSLGMPETYGLRGKDCNSSDTVDKGSNLYNGGQLV